MIHTIAEEPVIALHAWSIVWLIVPVAVLVATSGALRLHQARRIGLASARALVQLLAVGLIIGWVFERDRWEGVIGLLAVMATIAGITAAGQLGWARRWRVSVSAAMTLVLAGVTAAVLFFLTEIVVGVDGWEARYLIPLGGMLLGNAMTASTLSAERIAWELHTRRRDVEAMLALGAAPGRAVAPAFRLAVGAAIMPIINAMLIAGVVKLPGMMTGQMLGGSAPLQAALYQMVIMIGILTTNLLTAVLTATLTYRRFVTAAWQLDVERLTAANRTTRRPPAAPAA